MLKLLPCYRNSLLNVNHLLLSIMRTSQNECFLFYLPQVPEATLTFLYTEVYNNTKPALQRKTESLSRSNTEFMLIRILNLGNVWDHHVLDNDFFLPS